jgi:predicted lipoprotein
MALASNRPATSATRRRQAGKPFLGLIDAIVVESPAEYSFAGSVSTDHAHAVWTWMTRDLASDLIDVEILDDVPNSAAALDATVPDLLNRAREALSNTRSDPEAIRRIKSQLGGEEAWEKVPTVLNALRCRALLDKAQSFGRAANAMTDEAALALALQSMPLQDQSVAALLMHAAVGQVAAPTRLVTAAIRITNSAEEASLTRAGFAPLIDAILAHAQNQIPPLNQVGTFGDMDLICRSVDRFHRLIRAVTGYVELARGSRWSGIIAGLTKAVSERLDPKLRDVAPDLNLALRKREGADRVDGDQILSAMNGMYLLATVRDSRDSLAVNALFDQVWAQTGQALEIHIERNLEHLRRHPADAVAAARIDAALKMAEIRFNPEYAETMRRSKEAAMRRS